MSFFRGDRALSHFLRHDPFSPSTRPSLSPFYSPFFTFFDEPRGRYYDHSPQLSQQQPTLTQGSSKPSPSHKSDSSPQSSQSSQSSQEVTRTGGDEPQVERRHRHHRGGRHEAQQSPLSVLGGAPFTGSAWPSLFHAALSPFAPLTAAVRAIPDISVDVHSTPQSYSIHAAVPGMDKSDIKVTVDDGVLTIEAERREARTRQPTSATTSANSATTSTSSSTPSSTTSSAPSTSNVQPEAEMKGEESKESTEEKSAAPPSSSPSNTAGSTSGANNSATATATAANGSSAMEEDPEDFHYTETYYGRVERSIQLPEDAKVDDLTAKYENGVLKIDIPRVQEQKSRGRRIEIQ